MGRRGAGGGVSVGATGWNSCNNNKRNYTKKKKKTYFTAYRRALADGRKRWGGAGQGSVGGRSVRLWGLTRFRVKYAHATFDHKVKRFFGWAKRSAAIPKWKLQWVRMTERCTVVKQSAGKRLKQQEEKRKKEMSCEHCWTQLKLEIKREHCLQIEFALLAHFGLVLRLSGPTVRHSHLMCRDKLELRVTWWLRLSLLPGIGYVVLQSKWHYI